MTTLEALPGRSVEDYTEPDISQMYVDLSAEMMTVAERYDSHGIERREVAGTAVAVYDWESHVPVDADGRVVISDFSPTRFEDRNKDNWPMGSLTVAASPEMCAFRMAWRNGGSFKVSGMPET